MIPLCVILNNHALINATKSEASLVPPGIDSTLFTYSISVKHCNIFCIWDQSWGSDLPMIITTIQIIWHVTSSPIRKDLGSWNTLEFFPCWQISPMVVKSPLNLPPYTEQHNWWSIFTLLLSQELFLWCYWDLNSAYNTLIMHLVQPCSWLLSCVIISRTMSNIREVLIIGSCA